MIDPLTLNLLKFPSVEAEETGEIQYSICALISRSLPMF
jgi:hypothetical protein